ncbi:voltage-dependent calcium channel subunit alpha-2/delta-1-like [Pyxicephalus adspersus]|uniref:voltage-dependent calcium channel subunit alpha-2/delta-1-like n=1 Tax=Pyxicephalus adspersus TaxID=30357 RepID=UPI003B5C4E44
MAASWFLVCSLTLLQSMLICPSSEEYFPTAATIKQWVEKMQNDLVTLARTASGVDQLSEIYIKNRNLYTVEANNARQLVESAANNIEKLLRNRSKALVASCIDDKSRFPSLPCPRKLSFLPATTQQTSASRDILYEELSLLEIFFTP